MLSIFRRNRHQRGTVSVWITLGMLPLTAMMGFGIDVANVVMAQNNLQNYVDAKSVAGLKEQILAPIRVIEVGDFLNFHFEGSDEGEAELARGAWDFADASFETGGASLPGVPAMRAAIEEGDSFEYPLLFGSLLGIETVTLAASATAFTGKRHLVLVQDESGSMGGDPIDLAKSALTNFVQAFADQDLPGDMMGLVAFDSSASVDQEMTALYGGGESALVGAIDALSAGGGTDIADGIEEGRGVFPDEDDQLVNRIMVVVTDGQSDCDAANDQADDADDDDIEVFSVFIGDGASTDCSESLPRGIGKYYHAEDAGDLDDILTDIVSRVPVRLVQ